MHDATGADVASRDLLHFEKRIKVTEAPLLSALSDDGRRFAYVGYVTNKIFVVEIDSGVTVEVDAPEMRAKSWIAWHPDNEHFAVATVRSCLMISAGKAKCVRRIEAPDSLRLVKPTSFSGDGTKLYIQPRSSDTKELIFALEIATEKVRPIGAAVEGALGIASRPGRFQRLGGADILSMVVGYWRGEHTSQGFRLWHDHAVCMPLSSDCDFATANFRLNDNERDADNKGHSLNAEGTLLYSRPSNAFVFYRAATNMATDLSSYRAFEIFNSIGQRLSYFGDFDSLQRCTQVEIDVHPVHPWLISCASLREPDTVGEIIIWDLKTGSSLQKLRSGLAALHPLLSLDGRTLVTQDPHISVFRIN